jgi:alpha-aminoadipate carrier protein LysW
MAVQTASGQAPCPECGAELEISALSPLTLALAPQEEEDWGE